MDADELERAKAQASRNDPQSLNALARCMYQHGEDNRAVLRQCYGVDFPDEFFVILDAWTHADVWLPEHTACADDAKATRLSDSQLDLFEKSASELLRRIEDEFGLSALYNPEGSTSFQHRYSSFEPEDLESAKARLAWIAARRHDLAAPRRSAAAPIK